jgi:predicted DNA-binding transcriptional regulator YafY
MCNIFEQVKMNFGELKWDQILRFRLIEIVALWEGRLTTNHLCDAFKIGRQQASRDISKYKSLFEHEQIILDQKIKGYKPTSEFSPKFIKGDPGEYLSFLHQQQSMDNCFEFFNWGNAECEILNVPDRAVSPNIVRKLIIAARECRRVDVDYVSLSSPYVKGRIITPHTIIYDGVRWHVRAYCEEVKTYIDLVLSRFRNEPDLMDISTHARDEDESWNTYIDITFIPNPYLSEAQQEIISTDYNMKDKGLILNVRKPLIMYYKQRFHICEDKELLEKHPEQYHLTVASN